MFECTMTVEGDGKGKYGRSKNDRTGPVSMFMVDNISLYPKVKGHIKKCDKCCPQAALEFYLERRKRDPKFKGTVTGTLANMALSYERTFKGRIRKETVNEFLWRLNNVYELEKHVNRLTVEELARGAELCMVYAGKSRIHVPDVQSSMLQDIIRLVWGGLMPKDEKDIADLLTVLAVSAS